MTDQDPGPDMTPDPYFDRSTRPRGLRELTAITPPPIPEQTLTLPAEEEPNTPVLLDDMIPEAAAPPPDSPPGWFSVGSPLFNVGLVALLMGMSFLAVALPSRNLPEGRTASAALAFADPSTDDAATSRTSEPTTTTTTEVPLDAALMAELLEELRNDEPNDAAPNDEADVPGNSTDQVVAAPVAPTAPPQEIVQVVYRTEQVRVPAPTAPATTTTVAPLPQCSDFATRPLAQAAFDADPQRLSYFDGDGDGRACEQLPDPDAQPQVTCDIFEQQPDAQAIFDSDREGLSYLDGDEDGLACEQLPGAPVEQPELPPAAEVLSVTAVREQQGVFGLHAREAPWWFGEVDYLSRLIGKAPNNLLFFSNWSTPFPAEQVRDTWGRGMTPQVAWEPVIPGADSQPTLRAIADGEWDAYIDEWAQAAAGHGQPIVLRLAAEMNGNWYSWSEGVNGNEQGEFVEMWRHVYSRFELAGADNVIWLWSVNRSDNLSTDIANYWPGEEYTDWVGISGYWRGFQGAEAPTFDAVFQKTLAELRAVTAKPILLAEVGAGTDVDADRITWLTTLFAGLELNPDIVGFVYFNDVKSGGDWRIQFSQQLVDAFAEGVASERFDSGALPPGMALGERMPVPSHADPNNQGLAE